MRSLDISMTLLERRPSHASSVTEHWPIVPLRRTRSWSRTAVQLTRCPQSPSSAEWSWPFPETHPPILLANSRSIVAGEISEASKLGRFRRPRDRATLPSVNTSLLFNPIQKGGLTYEQYVEIPGEVAARSRQRPRHQLHIPSTHNGSMKSSALVHGTPLASSFFLSHSRFVVLSLYQQLPGFGVHLPKRP